MRNPKDTIIAIDFDGTIVDHRYPGIGQPIPLALYYIKQIQEAGAKIILYTIRSGKYLEEAVQYLKDNGIELWGVNENPDQHTWTNSSKVYADMYIDDAAFGCPLIEPEDDSFARPYVYWAVVGPAILRDFGIPVG